LAFGQNSGSAADGRKMHLVRAEYLARPSSIRAAIVQSTFLAKRAQVRRRCIIKRDAAATACAYSGPGIKK